MIVRTSAQQNAEYWNESQRQCTILNNDSLNASGWWDVRRSDIVTVPNTIISSGSSIPDENESLELLDKLKELSPAIAKDHALKSVALQQLKFRLIKRYKKGVGPLQCENSYIALSYRWPRSQASAPDTNVMTVPKKESKVAKEQRKSTSKTIDLDKIIEPPVPKILFRALLNERQSQHEGIWIDQLCIDQDDLEEKSITIPAMDLIYSRARVVVVVLGDILLTPAEIEVLTHFAHRSPSNTEQNTPNDARHHLDPGAELEQSRLLSMRSRDPSRTPADIALDLGPLIDKILSAEWFKRAWCNHEFRSSRRHVFLAQSDSAARPLIVRFTGSFLLSLLMEDGLPEPGYDELLARNTSRLYLLRLESETKGFVADENTLQEMMLRAYINIIPLGAGGNPKIKDLARRARDVVRDKYSIILNTMGKGICYKGDVMSEDDCYRKLVTLALAAGDPTALCTTGQRVLLGQRWSWMQHPIEPDFLGSETGMLHDYPPMPDTKITLDPSQNSCWICLDLTKIESPSLPADSTYGKNELGWAQMFIDCCIELVVTLPSVATKIASWVTSPSFPGLSSIAPPSGQQSIVYLLRPLLVMTLGCSLALGIDWTDRAYLPLQGYNHGTEERRMLSASLKIFSKIQDVDEVKTLLGNPTGRANAETILDFFFGMISTAIPFSSLILNDPSIVLRDTAGLLPSKAWHPQCFVSPAGAKVLTFIPLDPFKEIEFEVTVAIPTALLSREFRDLNRVWLIKEHRESGSQCWELIEKARLIGDITKFLSERSAVENIPQQRVYGPTLSIFGAGPWGRMRRSISSVMNTIPLLKKNPVLKPSRGSQR